MGLDFDGAEAHWSYSGFNRFREKLAFDIGIELNSMEGFCSNGKPWKIQDDIVPLLHHSDCDGYLTAKQCAKIAPRLLELIKSWPSDDWDKRQAKLLAQGMKRCAKAGRRLEFC